MWLGNNIVTHNKFNDIVVGVRTINCVGMPFVELKNRRALIALNDWGMRTQPFTHNGDITYRYIDGKVVAAGEGGIVVLEAQ